MNLNIWLGCVLVVACSALASAQASPNPWGAVKTPANGSPLSIGDYSAGCLQGARALPLRGVGYQVMHPSRSRYFGHPQLIDFVKTLGRAVHAEGLGVMLLGDMSQPRGGRALGGHASHQSGLDIDIWFWHPKRAEQTALSRADTEALKARSVLDAKNDGVQADWKSWVEHVLRLTVADARVERVFVHPVIKRELCALPSDDRSWLRKLRPWYGHDDHFHVRLGCPKDSPDCKPQAPVGAGDGCDALDFWFSEAARAARDKAQKSYQSKVSTARKWPAQCDAVLAAPDNAP